MTERVLKTEVLERGHIGPRLRLARIGSSRKIQACFVAKELGRSATLISLIEHGERNPGSAFVHAYERTIGVREGTTQYNYVSLDGQGIGEVASKIRDEYYFD